MQAADAPSAQVVGKKQLCAILGWSRPTLDARLQKDPNFPVAQQGGQGGGWAFDVAVVKSYLQPAHAVRTVEPSEGDNVTAFRPRVVHDGEATATQKLKTVQAQLAEDKLRKGRGELVEASAVRQVWQMVMVQLRSDLMNMPDQVARELDLSERVAAVMKRKTEAALRGVVAKIQQSLGDLEASVGEG